VENVVRGIGVFAIYANYVPPLSPVRLKVGGHVPPGPMVAPPMPPSVDYTHLHTTDIHVIITTTTTIITISIYIRQMAAPYHTHHHIHSF